MSLETIAALASGLHPQLPKVLRELQGLTISVLAGAAASTKLNLAAIRAEDTLVSVLLFSTGVPSDITGTTSISDLRASGTVTVASAVAADTVTVNGRVYTFRATGTAKTGQSTVEVNLGASDTITATNLAAAISRAEGSGPLFATSAAAVVTIKARAEGASGNSITLATSNNTRLAKSGATLAGGTANGGIVTSTDTTSKQVVLAWFNKR